MRIENKIQKKAMCEAIKLTESNVNIETIKC